MVVQLLGFLNLAVGVVMSFSGYQVVSAGHLKTLSQILIPLSHLCVGFGLIRFRSWARYWAVSLSCFYVVFGILSLKNTVSIIDFIPLLPLIESIPATFLRWWDPFVGSTLLFFVFPICVTAYLSVKNVAVTFESWLGGHFSWGAPFLVVLASAFIFSYTMLYPSQISFFLSQQSRSLFGFSLAPGHAQILRHVEFYLPLVLAIGLAAGGKLTWILTLLFVFYYWSPLLFGADRTNGLGDFKFLFFGIGWGLVALITLLYSRFFWQPRAWLDKRAANPPKGDILIEGQEVTNQPEAPSHFGNSLANLFKGRAIPLFILFGIGIVLSASALYFWSGERLEQLTKPKPQMSVSGAPFKLEGVSIDSQGAYAIVDGDVVGVGATVRGYRVETVEADRVLLSKDGERYWLGKEGNLKEMV